MDEQRTTDKKSISSLRIPELARLMQEMGQPPFRARQLFSWIHEKGAGDFAQMHNLPKELRAILEDTCRLDVPRVASSLCAKDGTAKYLLEYADGCCVEAVLMEYKYGCTLCISSQVGCRMGCRFCASAKVPFLRSLTAGEMAGEVYAVEAESGQNVARIVLMGVGEPLDNYDNVVDFIRLITDKDGKGMSARHISVSTCGLVPGIDALAAEGLPVTLSVSLHAAEDDVRSSMMPVNDRYPLEALMAACRRYAQKTGRRVTYEYALARGVNDTPQQAWRLATLLRDGGAHVNLIAVNPVEDSGFAPVDKGSVEAFRQQLEQAGITATVRRRLGVEIDAACGQLRGKDDRQ